ncbi:MAG: xanthine dehydrogenase accessory protein XdhC [Gammaproteobacteria bacterium]
MNWVQTLQRLQQQSIPAVMVTVASTIGSTPREPGAKMIVTSNRLYGTIGGGNLEHKASAIARSQLDMSESIRLRRFPLGAGLGQCCGGLVNLMFEPVLESSTWVASAARFQAQVQDWVRVVATSTDASEQNSGYLMLNAEQFESELKDSPANGELIMAAKSMLQGSDRTALQQVSGSVDSFFFDVSRKTEFQLVLFGAGHVGRALINILRDLPVQIRWIDSRDNQFPAEMPDNVEAICSDIPESEVDAAPVGSYFLVMTHDHALDQSLAEQILKRDDFSYFGLIGSVSKRRMFETRLHRRGMPKQRLGRMVCPIGVDGIDSKLPAAIAISVAAELMQVYDQSVAGNNYNSKMSDTLRSVK